MQKFQQAELPARVSSETRDIPFGRPIIGEEERAAVRDVLNGPILVHGPRSAAFEEAFAKYVGAPHAVSCSSCTAAMHLVYFALGFGPGDEVIVPAQTHVATAHAVELTGAKPIFVDAELRTGNIDIARSSRGSRRAHVRSPLCTTSRSGIAEDVFGRLFNVEADYFMDSLKI